MLGLYLCSINIPLPSRLGAFKFVSLFVGSAVVGCLAQFAIATNCANRNQDIKGADDSEGIGGNDVELDDNYGKLYEDEEFKLEGENLGSEEVISWDGSKDIDRAKDVSSDKSHITAICLGASGGISGLLMTAILWRPKAIVMLPISVMDGIPTWTYLALSLGSDILGLKMQMSVGSTKRVHKQQSYHYIGQSPGQWLGTPLLSIGRL